MFGDTLALSDGDISDTEIIERQKRMREKEKKKPKRLAYEMMKDPSTKQAVMKAATKAAKDALDAGADEIALAA